MTGVVTTTDDAGSSGESTETPLNSDVSVSDDVDTSTLVLVAVLVVAYLVATGVIA
ncbi:hypothetical protein [Halosegnis longus]|uniref:hypothetical protein n=1 Tax=Halosegnis longus TaxID=2216012 RepID=UPI00129E38C5|nr:hypothetical protein [Halosegnis longus]